MKVKVSYDLETSLVKGYYPENIKYSNIPEPFIEITEEEYNNRKDIMVVKDDIFQEYQKSQEEIDAENELQLKQEIQDARLLKLQELNNNYIASQTFTIKATDKDNKIINFKILARESWNGGKLTDLRTMAINSNLFQEDVVLYLPNTIGIYAGSFSKEEVLLLYKTITNQVEFNAKIETFHKVKILYLKTKQQINDYNVDVFEKDFIIDFDALIGRSKLFELQI